MKFEKVNVNQRSAGVDKYNAPATSFSFVKTIEMNIQLLTQRIADDTIAYKDATHIGLTFDKSLTDKMQIETPLGKYDIKLINNYGRMAQVVLKKVI